MAYIFDLVDQWADAAVTFTGIKLNVTDTASAAASNLMDLQVGGNRIFAVRRAAFSGTKTDRPAIIGRQFNYFITEASGFFGVGPSDPTVSVALVTGSVAGGGGGVDLVSGGFFAWRDSVTNAAGGTRDLTLLRDAANTLAQRNGVNAQAFNIYNTYTDASNYERGFVKWTSNELQIGTQALGTGSTRDVKIFRGAATSMHFKSGAIDVSAQALQLLGGAYLAVQEMSPPPAALANFARVFAEDDGAGKTRLMVQFGSGAAVQLAIEP
jgi:hypothetical protein